MQDSGRSRKAGTAFTNGTKWDKLGRNGTILGQSGTKSGTKWVKKWDGMGRNGTRGDHSSLWSSFGLYQNQRMFRASLKFVSANCFGPTHRGASFLGCYADAHSDVQEIRDYDAGSRGDRRAAGLFPLLRSRQDHGGDRRSADGNIARWRLRCGSPPQPPGEANGEFAANIAGQQTPGAAAAAQKASLPTQDASTVFDFQITPEWVVARWPTASTGLAQLQLEGYRVPLVTGTAQQDLAGSLTYYFNAEQRLQQITFIGTSGDPRPLIGLLVARFHLTRRLANDPGLVLYEAVRDNNKVASTLQIRLAPVTQAR